MADDDKDVLLVMPNQIEIAVLKEQMKQLKEAQVANALASKEMMTAQTTQFNQKFDDQGKLIGKIFDQLKEITGAMNRGKGAYVATITIAGGIGACVMGVIEYFRK